MVASEPDVTWDARPPDPRAGGPDFRESHGGHAVQIRGGREGPRPGASRKWCWSDSEPVLPKPSLELSVSSSFPL